MSAEASTFPLPIRLLNVVGQATRAKKLRRFRLEKDALLEAAMKKTGLSDFGHPHFEAGLRALLVSTEQDVDLHFFGRLVLRQMILDNLTNRLRLTEARTLKPEVFDAPLLPPLIVIGLYRSGTTYLHRLLAQDPAHYGPPYWKLSHPILRPGERDDRREVTVKRLAQQTQLLPDIDRIHILTADTPEECLFLLASSFECGVFWTLAPISSYMTWYIAQDHLQKYQEYRMWLQVLQAASPGKRLVLKAPEHTGALTALLQAVPEAQIVQLYRNPVTAYTSYNSMIKMTQVLTSTRPDVTQMAETNLRFFESEATRNLVAREANPNVVYDVRYDELVADPVGTLTGIYERFALDLPADLQTRLNTYAQANPKAKHGAHTYALEDFGVTEAQVRSRLAPYYDQFEV